MSSSVVEEMHTQRCCCANTPLGTLYPSKSLNGIAAINIRLDADWSERSKLRTQVLLMAAKATIGRAACVGWGGRGQIDGQTCSESRTLLALMLLMAGNATEPMLPTPMAANAQALLGASARATSLVKEAHKPTKPTAPISCFI